MKNILITTAFCLGMPITSYAQSSVTLYGLIDASLSWNTNANSSGKSVIQANPGQLAGDRWGISGTEDLGGGVKAIFLLENGYSIMNGTLGQNNRLFGRSAYVGIAYDRTSITMGRQYVIGFDAMVKFAPLGYANTNNNDALIPYKDAGGTETGSRQDNTIKIKQGFGDFTVGAAVAPGGVPGSATSGLYWGASGAYDHGPISAMVFAQATRAGGTNTGAYQTLGTAVAYSFTKTSVSLGYLDNRSKLGNGQVDRVFYSDLNYRISPSLLIDLGATYDRQTGPSGSRQTYVALVDYFLSKRTDIYVQSDYNKWGGKFSLVSGLGLAAPSMAYENRFGLAMGIRHRF